MPRHVPAGQGIVLGQDLLGVILPHRTVPGGQHRFHGLRSERLSHREEAGPSTAQVGQPFLEAMDTVGDGYRVDRRTVHAASSRTTTMAWRQAVPVAR